MGAIQAKNEIYEPKKLDAIYQNLVSNQQIGKVQDYEIRVDDFPVVGKNNDPSRFMTYADFISADSKCVTVFLYRSNGQSDKYFFHLRPDLFEKAQQLSGLNWQQHPMNEAEMQARWAKDKHYEELLKENADLKEEIVESEEIIKKMLGEIEEYKSSKTKEMFGLLNTLGGSIFSANPQQNPADTVSGVNASNTETSTYKNKGVPDEQVVNEESNEIIELTEKERGYLLLLDDIRNKFGEVELANVMHLLDLVSTNPQAVHFAIRHVTNFLNQHAKEGTNEKI